MSRKRNSLNPRSVVEPPSVGIAKNGTVLPEGLSRDCAITRAMNTRFLSKMGNACSRLDAQFVEAEAEILLVAPDVVADAEVAAAFHVGLLVAIVDVDERARPPVVGLLRQARAPWPP